MIGRKPRAVVVWGNIGVAMAAVILKATRVLGKGSASTDDATTSYPLEETVQALKEALVEKTKQAQHLRARTEEAIAAVALAKANETTVAAEIKSRTVLVESLQQQLKERDDEVSPPLRFPYSKPTSAAGEKNLSVAFVHFYFIFYTTIDPCGQLRAVRASSEEQAGRAEAAERAAEASSRKAEAEATARAEAEQQAAAAEAAAAAVLGSDGGGSSGGGHVGDGTLSELVGTPFIAVASVRSIGEGEPTRRPLAPPPPLPIFSVPPQLLRCVPVGGRGGGEAGVEPEGSARARSRGAPPNTRRPLGQRRALRRRRGRRRCGSRGPGASRGDGPRCRGEGLA